MLRGVSKQIIEINETGNEFFERAVLYVRRDYADMPAERLTGAAMKMLAAMDSPPASGAVKQAHRAKRHRMPPSGKGKFNFKRLFAIIAYPLLAAAVFLIARAF